VQKKKQQQQQQAHCLSTMTDTAAVVRPTLTAANSSAGPNNCNTSDNAQQHLLQQHNTYNMTLVRCVAGAWCAGRPT
jgi:hypothetical protein